MTRTRSRSDILCPKFLSECFSVDYEKGELVWKVRPLDHFKTVRAYRSWNSKYPGKRCCNPTNKKGKIYQRVCVNSYYVYVHQVIWILFYGWYSDEYEIDHIDRDGENNSIRNLRLANRSGQAANTSPNARAKLSSKGVYYDEIRGKYVFSITTGGETYRSRFANEESAAYIYRIFSEELYKNFSPDFLKDVSFNEDTFDWKGLTPKIRKTLREFSETRSSHKAFYKALEETHYIRSAGKTNSTGVNGVILRADKLKSGGTSPVYISTIYIRGRKFSKSFRCSKYGDELAFFAACEWRDKMERVGTLVEMFYEESNHS